MVTERTSYQSYRYRPGYWNGLYGGDYKGQYFNRESADRVSAMVEITSALRENGIIFVVERWKRYYRVMISRSAYESMPESLKDRIREINVKHAENW